MKKKTFNINAEMEVSLFVRFREDVTAEVADIEALRAIYII
jgi:hypothetical protein